MILTILRLCRQKSHDSLRPSYNMRIFKERDLIHWILREQSISNIEIKDEFNTLFYPFDNFVSTTSEAIQYRSILGHSIRLIQSFEFIGLMNFQVLIGHSGRTKFFYVWIESNVWTLLEQHNYIVFMAELTNIPKISEDFTIVQPLYYKFVFFPFIITIIFCLK